jgi:hypothetical protein
MAKKSSFTTVYDPKQAGTLAFATREEVDAEIVSYLDIDQQLKTDFQDEPTVAEGLKDLEHKLNALRISTESHEVITARLQGLVAVPVSAGQTLRLDAFRKTSAKATLSTPDEYKERVARLVRNTEGNLAQLLITWPDDGVLQRFMKDISEIDLALSPQELKVRMEQFSKSPQLWHYNEKKKSFLVEWLRPYAQYLDKPLEELTPEDMQKAVSKVEHLRDRKLEEMTNLVTDNDIEPFRAHNRTMHPVMNGKNKDFWGSAAVRDEFIDLIQNWISRFSINLEDRFLLFKTQDSEFCYLVGFSDDAFENMITLEDGRVGLYPHLRVFVGGGDGGFTEMTEAMYDNDASRYYQGLKTAVVPFLVSVAVMLERELSTGLKEAFDMWT